MNALLYPALLKMPFRMRLCPQHISNKTDARAMSTEVCMILRTILFKCWDSVYFYCVTKRYQ